VAWHCALVAVIVGAALPAAAQVSFYTCPTNKFDKSAKKIAPVSLQHQSIFPDPR
jgi:hypothetical protein